MLQPPSLPRSHHRQPGHTCKTSAGQTRLGRRHRQILRMRKRMRKPLLLCCPRRTPRDPTPDTSRLCPERKRGRRAPVRKQAKTRAVLQHEGARHATLCCKDDCRSLHRNANVYGRKIWVWEAAQTRLRAQFPARWLSSAAANSHSVAISVRTTASSFGHDSCAAVSSTCSLSTTDMVRVTSDGLHRMHIAHQ